VLASVKKIVTAFKITYRQPNTRSHKFVDTISYYSLEIASDLPNSGSTSAGKTSTNEKILAMIVATWTSIQPVKDKMHGMLQRTSVIDVDVDDVNDDNDNNNDDDDDDDMQSLIPTLGWVCTLNLLMESIKVFDWLKLLEE
jgi:hypothetical protein